MFLTTWMDLILRTAAVYELFPFIYLQCVVHWLYVGYLGNMWLDESHFGFHRDPNSNRCSSWLSLLKWLFRGPLVCSDTPIRFIKHMMDFQSLHFTPFQRIPVQRRFIWLQPMDKKQWSRWGGRFYRAGGGILWGNDRQKWGYDEKTMGISWGSDEDMMGHIMMYMYIYIHRQPRTGRGVQLRAGTVVCP